MRCMFMRLVLQGFPAQMIDARVQPLHRWQPGETLLLLALHCCPQ